MSNIPYFHQNYTSMNIWYLLPFVVYFHSLTIKCQTETRHYRVEPQIRVMFLFVILLNDSPLITPIIIISVFTLPLG